MVNLNIVEILVTVISTGGALILGKLHLPKATALELKKIIDLTNKDINEVAPNSETSNLSNIIDDISDNTINNSLNKFEKKSGSVDDLTTSIIDILKELNVEINIDTKKKINNIILNKTSSPKG